MKEDRKSNPQYTNLNSGRNLDKQSGDIHKESSIHKDEEGTKVEKLLNNNPGAFLLKEISEDEGAASVADKMADDDSDLEEEITEEDGSDLFNDDELNSDPY